MTYLEVILTIPLTLILTMKLRDLKFINQTDLKKLGDMADLETQDFIKKIQSMINAGRRINTLYRSLYETLLNDDTPENHSLQDSHQKTETTIYPIIQELGSIPIGEMEYYVESSDFSKNHGNMKRSLGIRNLAQLYSYAYVETPMRPCKEAAKRWQSFLVDHHDIIISNWREINELTILPQSINEDSMPIENINLAIKELILLLVN